MRKRKRKNPILKNTLLFCLCFVPLACMYSCRQSPRRSTSTPAPSIPAIVEPPSRTSGPPLIRVAVLKDSPAASITGGKSRKIFSSSGQPLFSLPDETPLQLSLSNGHIAINGKSTEQSALSLRTSSSGELLRLNDQDTATQLNLLSGAGGVTVIAVLDLETYLFGVLAGEVPFNRWHPEALKTQAVTSRSYAWNMLQRNAAQAYDVESTVMSQVFKAGHQHNTILSAAVNSTRGLVLTSDGKHFPAYFHSTCGDHTEEVSTVFPESGALAPLRGVPCGFCQESPAYRWKALLRKAELTQKLNTANINSLDFLDPSGRPAPALTRVATVHIRYSGGEKMLQGNQFRLAAGPRELKSLLFEQVIDRGDTLEINGAGFGHGVGLCQWGSQGMAQAGYSHLQILGKYFPTAALTRLY